MALRLIVSNDLPFSILFHYYSVGQINLYIAINVV